MNLEELELLIGYKFQNQKVLEQCLTHPSIGSRSQNYERLEFLGDTVLSFVITEYLVLEYGAMLEGDLAKKRSYLVSGHVATEIARKIGLGRFIIMSNSEQKSGGSDNDANLENVIEALIGSIYLDGGIFEVKNFIMKFWSNYLDQEFSEKDMNPKSYLQEWSLERGLGLPEYRLLSQSGFAHMPIFEIEVKIHKFPTCIGIGKSKKDAEIEAAKNLIKLLKN
jgi:ribonuclease-3